MSGHFERVYAALDRGKRDDELLSRRDFNERYWRSARASLTKIRRDHEIALRERDALKAVFDASE